MSFRLRTIFYVFAVVGSAIATFGSAGIGAAIFVVGFWWTVFYGPKWPVSPAVLLVYLLVIALFIVLFLPDVQVARESSRSGMCRNNLRQLALGLAHLGKTLGSLSPPYLTDTNGKPLLSWRVAILPAVEWQSLYEQFDCTLPWDAPANQTAVANAKIDIMRCPSDASSAEASYFAVVDPRTVWPGTKGYQLADVGDGLPHTILLIEAHRDATSWAKPEDLSFDDAVNLLSRPLAANEGHESDAGFFYKRGRGRHVAFADGSVACLQMPLSRTLAAALLTANGHEDIDDSQIQYPRLDFAKCYKFGLFVFVSLLPAAWVKLRRVPTADKA